MRERTRGLPPVEQIQQTSLAKAMAESLPLQMDLLGVGVGPANLSLAALLHPFPEVSSCFLEQRPDFAWHPGLRFPEASIQVHYLKDLVTLVDPTSPHSFLAFLVAKKRLYRFLITERSHAARLEFEEYYRWVAASLHNVRFSLRVEDVRWDGKHFVGDCGQHRLRSRHVVVATGPQPRVPRFARAHLGKGVFHAAEFLLNEESQTGRDVVVVGGGQTGAELVHHLLSKSQGRPRSVKWVTRRAGYLPLDDSAFTNELFLPNYARFFFSLPSTERAALLEEQKLASDGISTELLTAIYRRLYDLEFIAGAGRICQLLPRRQLIGIERDARGLLAVIEGAEPMSRRALRCDTILLATGYEQGCPAVLAPLLGRLNLEQGRPVVGEDFSIEWDGPADHRIYVQNAARHRFGVADPNLSLVPWRSATIVNSVLGRQAYCVDHASSAMDFVPLEEDQPEPAARRGLAPALVRELGLANGTPTTGRDL